MSLSSQCVATADVSVGGSTDLCPSRVSSARADYDRGALYTLALGTFAVGTEGFMIAAILPSIAHSLGTTVQAAGQLVTIFALTYAISSPLLTALTAAWPRRWLLMLSLAGFVVANLIAAAAPGYWWLAVARVLLALAAGLYVPNANANANAVAGALAPATYRGRALAIVNGGITVAVALGVPAGAFVSAHFGWRATFIAVAALSADTAVIAIGVTYLRTVGPFFGFFGSGYALYCVGQGAKRMEWPVLGAVMRAAIAVVGGYIAVRAGIALGYIFIAVSFGMLSFGCLSLLGLSLRRGFEATTRPSKQRPCSDKTETKDLARAAAARPGFASIC